MMYFYITKDSTFNEGKDSEATVDINDLVLKLVLTCFCFSVESLVDNPVINMEISLAQVAMR